jgi:zinc protease
MITQSAFRNRRLVSGMVLAMSAALLWLAPEPGTATEPVPRAGDSPYDTTSLANGLEVVAIENHNVPLATIAIAVRTGAFTEPDEFAGLSHLYEHMFFKANSVMPSQEQFMQRVRELGISFNGYTSEEVVVYYFTLPSKNLEAGMKFMADAIKTPLFKPDEMVKEREVVLGEFDRNEAQPTFVLRYALDSAMWMPYVSRKQPLGQRMVIKTATTEKMQMIKDRFYVPNNAALIVSGDIRPEQIFTLAKKYLSDWKQGPEPFPQYAPPAFPALKPTLVIREAKIPAVGIGMYFHGPSIGKDEPAPYAAHLIATMLRQPTSRFYHRLIDSGVATDMSVAYRNARNTGEYIFDVDVNPDKARQALTILKEEIKAMARPGYFTAEEIAIGKKIINDRSIFEQDNPQSFTIGTTARWWSMAGLDYYRNFPGNVQRMTEQELTTFVNTYLAGRPFVLGVGARKNILDQLNFTEEALQW